MVRQAKDTSYGLKGVTNIAKAACLPAVRVLASLAGRSAGPGEAEFVTDGWKLQKELSADMWDQPRQLCHHAGNAGNLAELAVRRCFQSEHQLLIKLLCFNWQCSARALQSARSGLGLPRTVSLAKTICLAMSKWTPSYQPN